jgi:hypothetical protein
MSVGVPAQRIHPAARAAHVAQQQLDHRHRADVLAAHRVLGPAQCVADRHHLVGCGRLAEHLRDLQELVLRRAGDLADQLGRVAAEVLLHLLVHAQRILQGLVDLDEAVLAHLVAPARLVVRALGFVVAAEEAVVVLVVGLGQERHVGVHLDVVEMDLVVAEQVVDDPGQEGDVGAHADRCIDVGQRRAAREARVDDDELGLACLHGLGHPLETAGVRFGGIAAHDENEVGILDVVPRIRHRSTSKRRAQTGHRRCVSDTRLCI